MSQSHTAFSRFIGIDYSGAGLPVKPLKGLRCYMANTENSPVEVRPDTGHGHWSRKTLALWLEARLKDATPTLVGIDHSFSFPIEYFRKYNLNDDWFVFLRDFCEHWPTGQDNVTVSMVREGRIGTGHLRTGSPKWRRQCEKIAHAKSVFHFGVPGSVAHSTHAGLPWLYYLKKQLHRIVHFWPYDGIDVPANTSVVAEAYPSLWHHTYSADHRTPDQHDAWTIAHHLQQAQLTGDLSQCFRFRISDDQRDIIKKEGWITGVLPAQTAAINHRK